MEGKKEKKVFTIPEGFSTSETKIITDLIKAINERHKKFGDNQTFDFKPLKDDVGHCKLMLHSSLRPYKMFPVEADTFAEAVGKMYIVIEEQLP